MELIDDYVNKQINHGIENMETFFIYEFLKRSTIKILTNIK